jgi:hypothetical protein
VDEVCRAGVQSGREATVAATQVHDEAAFDAGILQDDSGLF